MNLVIVLDRKKDNVDILYIDREGNLNEHAY